MKPTLAVTIGSLQLPNPVLLASGIIGYGTEYQEVAVLGRMGALVLKSTTLAPRAGNEPGARVVETPAGMLNSIGLENPGLEALIREKLPQARTLGPALIVSLAGETEEEFAELVRRLEDQEGIAALEINISCPNVKAGGMAFGVDPAIAGSLVGRLRPLTRRPLIPKLTPAAPDLVAVARACQEAGADALALINTIPGMAIDVRSRRPKLGANFGGLSGPAIKPVAVLRTCQVARGVQIPVIGMGGIWDAEDALEFIIAGATAVEVGTAVFVDPHRPLDILHGLSAFLAEQGIGSIRELVGTLQLNEAGEPCMP